MRGHTRGLARGGRGQEDRALQAEEMTPEDQSPVANVEGRKEETGRRDEGRK